MKLQIGKLSVGNRCFYDGNFYVIRGEMPDQWVLANNGTLNEWKAIVVWKHEVEPIASDIFEIGDEVKSKFWFTGTVTGYEPRTNRVVCISDKVPDGEDDRTRYAYRVKELAKKIQAAVYVGV